MDAPTLQQSLETVLARVPDMPAAMAEMRPDMVTPMALAEDLDRLAGWLDTQGIAAEEMDARTRAAYMIGGISWSVACWVAAFTLLELPLPGGMAVRQERYRWGEGTDAHDYVRYPVGLGDGPAPADPRALFEAMFAPLIAATMVTAGLSPGAQWRLVADSVAQGFLHVGEGLGAAPRARALAEAILAEGRLANGKTAFVAIDLPMKRAWFVSRGGCCRYYTTRGGDYCSSCVLRQREDQEARYRAYFLSVAAE
jgi:hypothetical protein